MCVNGQFIFVYLKQSTFTCAQIVAVENEALSVQQENRTLRVCFTLSEEATLSKSILPRREMCSTRKGKKIAPTGNNSFLIKHCENTPITKTRLYNFDPIKPHFYIAKLGFAGV